MISFTIYGIPKPLKRHRSTRTGRMYDPSAKDKKQISLQIAQFKPKQPFAGSIYLKVMFYMPRPKSHYRTGKYSHLLKDNVVDLHTFKPDLSNLIKLYEDILQPDFYVDDSQISNLQAVKLYGEKPRTEVFMMEIL